MSLGRTRTSSTMAMDPPTHLFIVCGERETRSKSSCLLSVQLEFHRVSVCNRIDHVVGHSEVEKEQREEEEDDDEEEEPVVAVGASTSCSHVSNTSRCYSCAQASDTSTRKIYSVLICQLSSSASSKDVGTDSDSDNDHLPTPDQWQEITFRNEFVDYVAFPSSDAANMTAAIQRAIQLKTAFVAQTQHLAKTVIVWDLDRTIITDQDAWICSDITSSIAYMSSFFDYKILWSHGNEAHVQHWVRRLRAESVTFDYIIWRKGDETRNKGAGLILSVLNKAYHVGSLRWAILVDDLAVENASRQYDRLLCVDHKQPDRFYSMLRRDPFAWCPPLPVRE